MFCRTQKLSTKIRRKQFKRCSFGPAAPAGLGPPLMISAILDISQHVFSLSQNCSTCMCKIMECEPSITNDTYRICAHTGRGCQACLLYLSSPVICHLPLPFKLMRADSQRSLSSIQIMTFLQSDLLRRHHHFHFSLPLMSFCLAGINGTQKCLILGLDTFLPIFFFLFILGVCTFKTLQSCLDVMAVT